MLNHQFSDQFITQSSLSINTCQITSTFPSVLDFFADHEFNFPEPFTVTGGSSGSLKEREKLWFHELRET